MKLLMAAQRADEIGICERVNEQYGFDITYTTRTLSWDSREMAQGYEAVAVNAGCIVDEKMAAYLHEQGVKYLLTRTAGSDHLDVAALAKYGIPAANVPAYSPGAIAEHTVLLLLCALRRLREQLHRMEHGCLGLSSGLIYVPSVYADMDADLVLMDVDRLQDNADFMHPRALCSGIEKVLVGGVVAYENGRLTGANPGRCVLRQ